MNRRTLLKTLFAAPLVAVLPCKEKKPELTAAKLREARDLFNEAVERDLLYGDAVVWKVFGYRDGKVRVWDSEARAERLEKMNGVTDYMRGT